MKLIYILLALSLLLVGCPDVTQHDQSRYGTITVWLSPDWALNVDRADIAQELTNLGHLGPSFVVTDDIYTADVLVYPFVANDCQQDGAGHWVVGTRSVYVDRVCTTSQVAFRTAIGHEIGHAIGMQHVCFHEELIARSGNCSPVGYGLAMMNPSLYEGHGDLELPQATDVPTELDLMEFNRTRVGQRDAGAPRE